MEPGRDRRWVTAAVMAGTFLAALEATAVATAMPTAASELGSVTRYSWAFSAYLITSTTTVPFFGKLADLQGRRRIYIISVIIFMLGSALCGTAATFGQLILFRAVQGLGAGGVMPVAITVAGDIYPLEERGRIQGLFSGVWAVSSLAGPFVGGLVTDLFSWRWVFYLNLPFGLASALLLRAFLREETERRTRRLDVTGTLTLTAAVALLLVAIQEGAGRWGWWDGRTMGLLALSLTLLGLFFRQERRAPDPMLPLSLFSDRVIAVASVGNIALGTVLYAVTAFVPVFTQGILGGTAADAGATLMPMSIGWPLMSTLAGWMLYRTGYRILAVGGGVLSTLGCYLLTRVGDASTRGDVMLAMLVLGAGMGLLSTPYIVAVQSAVPWSKRGVATSSQQFFRTIGGAIAVAVLGLVLNAHLGESSGNLTDTAQAALDPQLRQVLSPSRLNELLSALQQGLHSIYVITALLAVGGLLIALSFPGGSVANLAHEGEESEQAGAEQAARPGSHQPGGDS